MLNTKDVCYCKEGGVLIKTSIDDKIKKILFSEGIKMANSPYTPGAGSMPNYLSGRDKTIQDAAESLQVLSSFTKTPQSIIYYGLRGVGKTVLLNKVEDMAMEKDILCQYIEVSEIRGFKPDFVDTINDFVTQLSFLEKIKDTGNKIMRLLSRFNASWSPTDNTFSLTINGHIPDASLPPNLSFSLTDLLVELGNVAKKHNSAVCFLIDEMQYLSDLELEALITAIHRCNQKGLPVMLFGAGLPKILATVSKIKTYSERLFQFVQIDSLSAEESRDALIQPAKTQGVTYQESAIEFIIHATQGYPYFLQAYGDTVWTCMANDSQITLEDAQAAFDKFTYDLDHGFFQSRFDRATNGEKNFMFAMAQCDGSPTLISDIARVLHKNQDSISPVRANLINKGFIYATGYGELDFTVPQFANFLLRKYKTTN